jgi:hypothetical protein
LWLVVSVIVVVSMWKLFDKAGRPGWAAIVPFYNIIVMLDIPGRPAWWLILCFIPFVIIVPMVDFVKAYGKDAIWGVGIYFLGFIFLPLMAFGDAQYQGGGAGSRTMVGVG